MYSSVSYGKQTSVYFKKIARIALREKVWKFVIFAGIIAVIVGAVCGKNMVANSADTRSGFFVLCSASIWLGIFNSIQSVCKEHDIVRSEYRQGMNLASYVTAHVLWQAILCFVQATLVFLLVLPFGYFSTPDGAANTINAGVLDMPLLEYYVTIYLLIFGAAVLGLMVSCIAGDPTTAMTIMPFVLIIQLIMCGVLFKIQGVGEVVSFLTFSRWGIGAMGATVHLDQLDLTPPPHDPPYLSSMLHSQQAYNPDMFSPYPGTVLGAWGMCLLLTAVFAGVAILALVIKNRDS